MDEFSRESSERGDRAAGWRRQRRLLLFRTGAAWAMAMSGSLRVGYGETIESPGVRAPARRQAVASPGGISATILREIDFDRPSRVANHMAWSADGTRLAIGGSLDRRMSVLDVATGRALPAPGDQLAGVRGLAYSPNGRFLAVIRAGTGRGLDPGAPRYSVSLWDARSAAPAQNIVEPESGGIESIQAHDLSFSSDSRYLSVAYLKQLAVYALKDSGEIERVAILPQAARCAFRPGAPIVAALGLAFGNKRLALYQVKTGEVTAQFDVVGTNLGWSGDGRLLAIANEQRINLYDMTRAQEAQALSIADPDVQFQSVSFSADGRWLVAASHRRVELWDANTWSHASSLHQSGRFIALARFSPQANLLAVVGDAPVAIWTIQ